MIGTTVGGYKIVSKLSTGGMGTIYRAEHALIGKAAAVKILHPQLSHNTEIVNRFFNEAKATTSIKHPGIVEVFDFGYLEDGDAYLTMEFLEGVNLAKWLEQHGKRPEGEAAMLLRSVCNALAAAHAKGIIHRDLKPDNIFMVPDPESALGERPKILDFGIAKLNDVGAAATATRTGAVMGTPTYMSPEQCKGAGVVDHRADLYSIGCIFYELVCGKPPFTEMGAGEMIGAHLFMTPPGPREHTPELSDACEGLILALLDKDPNKRPQTARELSARLTELAQQNHWVAPGAPEGVTAPSLVPLMRPTPFPARDSGPIRASAASPTPVASTPGEAPSERPSRTAMGRAATAPNAGVEETPPKPTTLSGAASQRFDVPDAPPRSRKGLAIIASAGAVLIGGIVAFSLVGSKGSTSQPAKAPITTPTAAPATPEPTPAPSPPAPPPPTPTPAAPPPTAAMGSNATDHVTAPAPANATTTKLSPTAAAAIKATMKVPKKPPVQKPNRPLSTDPPKPKKPNLIETDL